LWYLNLKDLIKKHENEIISNIQIVRTPLAKAMDAFINVASKGKVEKVNNKGNYDDLYHLNINLTTTNNNTFVLEVRFYMYVDYVPANLTIGQLLSNTKKRQGDNCYRYSASSNNCQKFIKDVFESNGINDEKFITFIKQDTAEILKNPNLRKFANTVTDGAAFAVKIGDYANKYKHLKNWFGSGIVKQDLNKLKVAELKAIIKLNKKVYNRKVNFDCLNIPRPTNTLSSKSFNLSVLCSCVGFQVSEGIVIIYMFIFFQ
jgi:hypothetical protein